MTDIYYLKECYTEYRKEMKRGYGVHSFETDVPKKRIAEAVKMVDRMKFVSNNQFNGVLRNELTEIMGNRFSVVFKSTLNGALESATYNQFIQLEKVIKRECRRV
jgi:hypothetical protein